MGAVSIIYVPFLILLRTVYDKQVWKIISSPGLKIKSTTAKIRIQMDANFLKPLYFQNFYTLI